MNIYFEIDPDSYKKVVFLWTKTETKLNLSSTPNISMQKLNSFALQTSKFADIFIKLLFQSRFDKLTDGIAHNFFFKPTFYSTFGRN